MAQKRQERKWLDYSNDVSVEMDRKDGSHVKKKQAANKQSRQMKDYRFSVLNLHISFV